MVAHKRYLMSRIDDIKEETRLLDHSIKKKMTSEFGKEWLESGSCSFFTQRFEIKTRVSEKYEWLPGAVDELLYSRDPSELPLSIRYVVDQKKLAALRETAPDDYLEMCRFFKITPSKPALKIVEASC